MPNNNPVSDLRNYTEVLQKMINGDEAMTRSVYPVLGTEINLPFYLTGIGTTDPEYHIIRSEGLASYQIMFTTGGSGMLISQGKYYPQTKGTCTFIPPGVPHEYYPEKGDWQTSWVVFRGDQLPQIMPKMGLSGIASVRPVNMDALSHIFIAMFTLAEEYTKAEKCSELLYTYILEAKRLFSDSAGAVNDRVGKAVEFMEKEYHRDLSLSDISDAAGLSEQHFCRIFRKATGMTPIEFLTKKRVAEAKALLDDTDMSVSDIAGAVGFSGRSYFTSVFRKYEGFSPTEYKKLK